MAITAHIHWHLEQILCSVHGVYGLPASKLLSILCTYVSSSIFLAFISYPVEVQLVNVSEIMGKLKKTPVTKDAATSSGGIIRNWACTHFQEDMADNADCQLQYKRLQIGDPLLGLCRKQQMHCTLCVLQ